MSGRMDLEWNGRDITIERRTKGRSIMGDFKAYETDTGLPIPELTAANCGQMLLGVEKSVFTRAGFLKLTDLPVTQDESLRRRLNALVTTGDESGEADVLAQKLKELKNKVRFNKTGLLPQAEAQRDALRKELQELEALQGQSAQLKDRQQTLEQQIAALENHQAALAYAAAEADAKRLKEAEQAKNAAAGTLETAQAALREIPSREEAGSALRNTRVLQQQLAAMQEEVQNLSPAPEPPEAPTVFLGMEDISEAVEADANTFETLSRQKLWLPFLIAGLLFAAAAVVFLFVKPLYAIIPLIPTLVCGLLGIRKAQQQEKHRDAIAARYGCPDPDIWWKQAQDYLSSMDAYTRSLAAHNTSLALLESRLQSIREKLTEAAHGLTIPEAEEKWGQVIAAHDAAEEAAKEYQRAMSLYTMAASMAKTAQPPRFPDDLTCSAEETQRRLSGCLYEKHQLQLKLGQTLGRMENLGQPEALQKQLAEVNARIAKLEDTYTALVIAQQTLTDATAQLQRRFAPRISQRAQTLFSQLTEGRYDRLTLSQDLSLNAGAQGEDTLRSSLWRSDGTVDQLYLALRLAVAGELTPEAPLILDDALVRFDDKRLAAAMGILRKEAETRQVILFTCQGREKNM